MLLIVAISAITLPLMVVAVQRFTAFSPDAAGMAPDLLTVSNITNTTATITWRTKDTDTITNLQWGSDALLGNIATDVRDIRDKSVRPRSTHFVQLTGLNAGTTYYYRIVSANTTFPSTEQTPLTFKTLSTSAATTPTALTLYGDTALYNADTVVTAYTLGVLGYANTIPLSTILNTDGTWLLNLAEAKSQGGSLLTPDTDTPVAIVATTRGGMGFVGSATSAQSPITLTLTTTLTQASIDQVLLQGRMITTPATTSQTTIIPSPTGSSRQDFPLKHIGTTATPTPSTGAAATSLTKEQLFSSFSTPSISNITDGSLSIMFLTSLPTTSSLNWGTLSTSLTNNRLDDLDNTTATDRHMHHYTITGLSAHSSYYFKPTTETTVRTFTTPIKIAAPTGQTIITGTLVNTTGECLVRTQIKRSSLYSSTITTIPNASHTWAINVMPVRTNALDTYMIPVATDTVLSTAFCIDEAGNTYYKTGSTTLQNAVTSGINLILTKLQ